MKKLPNSKKDKVKLVKVQFVTEWEQPQPRVLEGDILELPIRILRRRKRAVK